MHNEPQLAMAIIRAISRDGGPITASGIAEHVAPQFPNIPIGYLAVKSALALRFVFEIPDVEDIVNVMDNSAPRHGLTGREAGEALEYSARACEFIASDLRTERAIRKVARRDAPNCR